MMDSTPVTNANNPANLNARSEDPRNEGSVWGDVRKSTSTNEEPRNQGGVWGGAQRSTSTNEEPRNVDYFHPDSKLVTAEGIDNLPPGTTDQEVSNAVSNAVSIAFVTLLQGMIEASENG